MFVIGVVDDEGVGERERRDIGERDRDLIEPDEEEFDDEDDDRLIGAFVLCCFGDDDDDDDVAGTTSAFASSGRGVGRKLLNDNVLTTFAIIMKRSSYNDETAYIKLNTFQSIENKPAKYILLTRLEIN